MKYLTLLIFTFSLNLCSCQTVRLNSIIYDRDLELSCFDSLTDPERTAIEEQQYQQTIDSTSEVDFMGNRARLVLENTYNGKLDAKENSYASKRPISCNCYYMNDTLIIQVERNHASGFPFSTISGTGYDIVVVGDKFYSSFYAWNNLHAIYRHSNDSIYPYILVHNASQELKLVSKFKYKKFTRLSGILKYETEPITITNKEILLKLYTDRNQSKEVKEDAFVSKGTIKFTCNKLRSSEHVIKKKEFYKGKTIYRIFKFRIPFHMFDKPVSIITE